MPRPRKNPLPVSAPLGLAGGNALASWAEQLGEALGRGVARGINVGLSSASFGSVGALSAGAAALPRRRGRPPKVQPGGPIPADRVCSVPGCGRQARSKGLCSRHYQAERRKSLKR